MVTHHQGVSPSLHTTLHQSEQIINFKHFVACRAFNNWEPNIEFSHFAKTTLKGLLQFRGGQKLHASHTVIVTPSSYVALQKIVTCILQIVCISKIGYIVAHFICYTYSILLV